MEDPTFIRQYQMDPLDFSLDELSFQSFSPESHPPYPNFNSRSTHNFRFGSMETPQISIERPAKQLKSWNSCTKDQITLKDSSASSHLISFENSKSSAPANSHNFYHLDRAVKSKEVGTIGSMKFPSLNSQGSYEDQNCSPKYGEDTKRVGTMVRTPSHAQDHAIEERKRREKINQQLIALSAIVPGLRKMDKISVLGEATKYLKQLQERVKKLEEQAAKKTMVLVKKSHLFADDDISSSDENIKSFFNVPHPEIGVRVLDNDILIRIQCEKYKGCVANILSSIERLHLIVINFSVLPFGNFTLDLTVIAQMDVGFCMTIKEFVKNLQQALIC